MSTPPENPPAGSTTVVKTANNAVARKGARALQELALQTREGEWLLQINLALTPVGSSLRSPGDGDEKDAPADGEEKDAPGDGDEKDAPGDGDEKDAPNDSVTSSITHAPIELRGASVTVRFATHSAKKAVQSVAHKTAIKGRNKRNGKTSAGTPQRKI